jgi:NtrC-family two-component system response regulator AlgB
MQRVLNLARQGADSEASILLRGESGTGKSVLARAIHAWSRRADRPLGVISCPSLPAELLESEMFGHVKGAFTGAVRDNPGRVALCEGGTLLLDEIGDLPLPLQPKLLRFLQDREYESVGDATVRHADVRIVAETNMDLDAAVREKRFREDLFYRLNVIPIAVPALRDRPDDILPLADHLLAFFGRAHHRTFAGFTESARQALSGYAWPGNVRELRNVVERAAILCPSEWVGEEFLPESIAQCPTVPHVGGRVTLEEIEEQHIRRVLAVCRSLQDAADVLGIDQATLWRKRKQYGI